MEGHHVAVDRHQAEQPGGADEQQQEEGHSECRTEEAETHTGQLHQCKKCTSTVH